MEFEYDPVKSKANLRKHGIDFETAKELWNDLALLEFPARSALEPRFSVVGQIGSKHWSAIVTYRNDRVRIISVRRARDEEIKRYESA